MATVELTSENFASTIKDNDLVLVDFWAEWCGPCKRFGPVYDQVSKSHEDIVFGKLDTEANGDIAGGLGIQAIPTLMAFKNGNLVFNQAGALNAGQLEQLVGKVKDLDVEDAATDAE